VIILLQRYNSVEATLLVAPVVAPLETIALQSDFSPGYP
jgi:hypothetical protein